MKACWLQLLKARSENDKKLVQLFCVDFHRIISDDESFMSEVVFSDEATFRVSGKVNTLNCCICAVQHPRVSVELQRDLPKVYVLCIIGAESVRAIRLC
jgi:hypothetical protein